MNNIPRSPNNNSVAPEEGTLAFSEANLGGSSLEPEKSMPSPVNSNRVRKSLRLVSNAVNATNKTQPTQKGPSAKEILKLHDDFKLDKKNQYQSSKQFMNKVMYSVPLNKLYQVMASCQYNEDSEFCPVLVKIVDEDILRINLGKRFLLQVWSSKGDLIFERSLTKPISNWNISQDKFCFQESRHSSDIYIVKLFLDRKPHLYKFCLPSEIISKGVNSRYDSNLERFVVPTDGQVNDIDSSMNQYEEADVSKPIQVDEDQLIQQEMVHGYVAQDQSPRTNSTKSVTELLKEPIIVRTPDKMIDYLNGYILLAYRDLIVYINVTDINIDEKDELDDATTPGTRKKLDENNFTDCEVSRKALCYLDLHKGYKIICIQEIGNEMSALVLEDKQTRQIRFLRCVFTVKEEVGLLKLVQLGVMVDYKEELRSPLLKYRSVAKYDPSSKKHSQVGIVVRENGRLEVYSDFMLVSDYLNAEKQCVDIETDFNQFFLKFVVKSDLVTEDTEIKDLEEASLERHKQKKKQRKNDVQQKPRFEIRQMRHFWRNRISYNTSSEMKNFEAWNQVLHYRISKYVQLYSQILDFSMFILVSHRNMISVFDMRQKSEKNEWKHTKEFKGGFIRKMFTKQKCMEKSSENNEDSFTKDAKSLMENNQIVCFIGLKEINFIKLTPKGQIEIDTESNENLAAQKIEHPIRILKVVNDDIYRNGIMILADEYHSTREEFEERDGCKLHTFPLRQHRSLHQNSFSNSLQMISKQSEFLPDINSHQQAPVEQSNAAPKDESLESSFLGGKVSLYCLKYGKLYPLIDSFKSTAICHDSFFQVMRISSSVYNDEEKVSKKRASQSSLKDFDEQEKDIEKLKIMKSSDVLVCSSQIRGKSFIYPIVKKENDDGGLDDLYLIRHGIVREVERDLHEEMHKKDKDTTFYSFFADSKEYGSHDGDFAQISQDKIKIYDKNLHLRLLFNGINTRNCRYLHQSYLYTIADEEVKPYELSDFSQNDGPEKEAKFRYKPSGLYVMDTQRLFEGKIERYKLVTAIGGVCNHIDINRYSNRLSFVMDYNKLAVIPFPHLNLINCVGMSSKHQYMIWREKAGFFTALDCNNMLLTWSLLTGKLLYSEDQRKNKDANSEVMEKYEVYRSDETDINYTQNFYDLEECSLTLLKSKSKIDEPPNGRDSVEPGELDRSQSAPNHFQFQNDEIEHVRKVYEKQKTQNNLGYRIDSKNSKIKMLEDELFVPTAIDQELKVNIEVRNSQQQSNLYHFRVMQLRTREDFDADKFKKSECKLRFHFYFSLIKQQDHEDLKMKDFDWDINTKPVQRLWLSKDTKLLMEVINNFIGTVYKRVNIGVDGNKIKDHRETDDGQLVQWKVLYHIKRFPRSLVDQTSVPYLFSPNFRFQLDFNFRKKEFLIRTTETQKKYMSIPKDLVNMEEWDHAEGQGAIQIMFSRMMWRKEDQIQIINESNIECLFDIKTEDPEDKVRAKRYLKLVSSVKIDNEFENMRKRDSPHMIVQPIPLVHRDVLERLIRMNQNYKTSMQHAINLGDKKLNLLRLINKIDYTQPWGKQSSSFDVETSFTWLDWRILELITSDAVFSVENVDREQALQLCFNIWPKGRGVLHMLVRGRKSEDDQIQAYFAAIDLFRVAKEYHQMDVTGDDYLTEGTMFEVPILPDIYGQTPLDMCLGINIHRCNEDIVFQSIQSKIEKKKDQADVTNEAMAEIIFKNIKDFSYMQASQIIHEAVIDSVRKGLPSIGPYLESRMIKPTHLFETTTQRDICKKRLKSTPALGEYGLMSTQVWAQESEIVKAMFKEKGPKYPMSLKYLDIPYMYARTERGMDFIDALADTSIREDDMSLFSLQSVQIIIDMHSRFWRKINMLFFGLPLVVQILVFWLWSNFLLPGLMIDEDDGYNLKAWTSACEGVLNFISFYFLILEIPQIIHKHLRYFLSLEKLIIFVSPVFILYNTINQDLNQPSFWTIQSWSALMLFLRLVLYLRVFQRFGWLIHLIVHSLADMTMFLIVLVIGIFAFADAFMSIDRKLEIQGKIESEALAEDATDYEKYWQGYIRAIQNAFIVSIGDFDYELNIEQFNEGEWVIFILCAVLNVILLLNLLIAIISQTFQKISQTKSETGYYEKTKMVLKMQTTFKKFFKLEPDHNERVFLAQVIKSDQMQKEDVTSQIDDLREQILDLNQAMENQSDDLKSYFDHKLDLLTGALSNKLQDSGQTGESLLHHLELRREQVVQEKREKRKTIAQALQEQANKMEKDPFNQIQAFVSNFKRKQPDVLMPTKPLLKAQKRKPKISVQTNLN